MADNLSVLLALAGFAGGFFAYGRSLVRDARSFRESERGRVERAKRAIHGRDRPPSGSKGC